MSFASEVTATTCNDTAEEEAPLLGGEVDRTRTTQCSRGPWDCLKNLFSAAMAEDDGHWKQELLDSWRDEPQSGLKCIGEWQEVMIAWSPGLRKLEEQAREMEERTEKRRKFCVELRKLTKDVRKLKDRMVHNKEMRRQGSSLVREINERKKTLNIEEKVLTPDLTALALEHRKQLESTETAKFLFKYRGVPTPEMIDGFREDLDKYNKDLDRREEIRPEMFKGLREAIEMLKDEEIRRFGTVLEQS